MADLIYPELSYEIVGVLFDVYNKLGSSYKEKYYQRAVGKLLLNKGFDIKRELKADLEIQGEQIGYYFLNFLVEGLIVLELKAKPRMSKQDFKQVQSYLGTTGLKLGILANFGRPEGLNFYRVLNSSYSLFTGKYED
ncbi:MAG: GxxExxY protein [Patescibacteria group bacterium]|nr:GxxExxY protein [Patescibacteria group bacterium]